MKKDEKVISLAKQRYKVAQDAWEENKNKGLEDLKFAKLGEQWPDEIKRKRDRESRPALTFNRLPAIIRQVVNDVRLNTPQIKVNAMDSNADPDTAEVINGIVRNIQVMSNADLAYENAMECSTTSGFGFFRVAIDYSYDDSFDMDIKVERIANPFSVTPDPYTTEADASDWNFCFVEETLSKEEFKEAYPNAEIADWESEPNGWVTEDTVRVCEYYERKENDIEILLLSNGIVLPRDRYEANIHLFQELQVVKTKATKSKKVIHRIITATEILEETELPGTLIPVVPCYGEEIWDGEKRHLKSLIRDAKDPQMNYNFQRTAYTERTGLSTKAPWIGPTGAFDTDIRKWETANSDTHPFIEYDGPVPPQQVMPNMPDSSLMQDAMASADDIKSVTGVHDASLGLRGNETSGVAINARQREGDVSTYAFIDNLTRAIRYAGKVILEYIPHVYDQPRLMRVIGVDESVDTVQVNQKFEQNGIVKMHDLTVGKYDLVIDTGPSFSTQREEARESLIEIMKTLPDAAPILGDLAAKAMDFPGADEMAKRLKVMLPPQIQAMDKMDGLPPEAQAAIAQLQQQNSELNEVIQQGQQLLQQKDEQIKAAELEQKSKTSELIVKDEDSKRRYEAAIIKVQSDQHIAELKEREENRRMVIEESIEAIKCQLTDNQDNLVSNISQLSHDVKNKQISITAPSGQTYNAIIENGEIAVDAPGGTYTGTVEEI